MIKNGQSVHTHIHTYSQARAHTHTHTHVPPSTQYDLHCMWTYVNICLYMSLYVSICLYMSLYVSTSLYISLYVLICLYIVLYMSICLDMSLYVSTCLYVSIYACAHTNVACNACCAPCLPLACLPLSCNACKNACMCVCACGQAFVRACEVVCTTTPRVKCAVGWVRVLNPCLTVRPFQRLISVVEVVAVHLLLVVCQLLLWPSLSHQPPNIPRCWLAHM